jgi:hypothetical protein
MSVCLFHVRNGCTKTRTEAASAEGRDFFDSAPSTMALFLSWESEADGHGSSWLQVLQCPKGQQLRITWDEMLRVGTL